MAEKAKCRGQRFPAMKTTAHLEPRMVKIDGQIEAIL
jgi:hypothetical protein